MLTKTAVVKQVQGITFAGKTDSNHWVVMDGPAEFGGSNAGIRPKELDPPRARRLHGQRRRRRSCGRRKCRSTGIEVRLTAEQAEEHPQVFTSIHVEYVFRGDGIRAADVERAIELSETKYCSVSAMLRASVAITHSYRIEPALVAA